MISDAEKYGKFLNDDEGRPSTQRLLCLKSYHHSILIALIGVLASVAGKVEASKMCIEIFYVLIIAAFAGKVAGRYMEKSPKDCPEDSNIKKKE